MAHKRVDVIGSGKYAQLASDADKIRDENGFTHPNLHQRVNPKDPPVSPEISPRMYKLAIQGIYLLRTTIKSIHSEEENPDEIP